MGTSPLKRPAPRSARGRLREIHVEWSLYDIGVYCVVGPYDDLHGYVKWRQKRIVGLSGDRPEALYVPSTRTVAGIIWLPAVPRTARSIGTLTHEVCHAAIDLMRSTNIAVSERSQEPFCYAVGHAVAEILTALRTNPSRRSRPE